MHAAGAFTQRIYSSPLARPGTFLYRRNFEVSQAEASSRRATSALRQTKTDNDFVVLRGGSAEVYDHERKTPPIEFSEDDKLFLFGDETVTEVWTIALVYFVQGILDISVLAESFYYKDTLHLGPAELSMISSIALLPWVMKPFYGFISDSFPLFGYRRRSSFWITLERLMGGHVSPRIVQLLPGNILSGTLGSYSYMGGRFTCQ